MSVLNPWGLTLTEVDVMDTLCQLGRQGMVANRLHVNRSTVTEHLSHVAAKMGYEGAIVVLLALQWDRWRQGDGKGVPA